MNEFPKLKLCIAHFGRCFTPYHFSQAIEKMGEDIHWPYFDTAAVLNPEVYELALNTVPERILFGTDETDLPMAHGQNGYQNLAREVLRGTRIAKAGKQRRDIRFTCTNR